MRTIRKYEVDLVFKSGYVRRIEADEIALTWGEDLRGELLTADFGNPSEHIGALHAGTLAAVFYWKTTAWKDQEMRERLKATARDGSDGYGSGAGFGRPGHE